MSSDVPPQAPRQEDAKSSQPERSVLLVGNDTDPDPRRFHSIALPKIEENEDETSEFKGDNFDPRRSSKKDSVKEAIRKDSQLKEQNESKRTGGPRRVSMFDDTVLQPTRGPAQDAGTTEFNSAIQNYFLPQPKDQVLSSTKILKPLRRPKIVYENTYQLESHKPFSPSRVQTLIQQILDEMLMDFKYNSKTSANKSMEVAEKMRRSVLSCHFDRYKICVLVTISPLNRQGFFSGFRCLWDANRDSYAVATMRNTTMFATAVVYAVYFE